MLDTQPTDVTLKSAREGIAGQVEVLQVGQEEECVANWSTQLIVRDVDVLDSTVLARKNAREIKVGGKLRVANEIIVRKR